jgi:hypothetical protein
MDTDDEGDCGSKGRDSVIQQLYRAPNFLAGRRMLPRLTAKTSGRWQKIAGKNIVNLASSFYAGEFSAFQTSPPFGSAVNTNRPARWQFPPQTVS